MKNNETFLTIGESDNPTYKLGDGYAIGELQSFTGDSITAQDNGTVSFQPLPATWSFCNGNQKMLFTIYADGTIEKGELFTTNDEASLEFWRVLTEVLPNFKKALLENEKP